MKFSERTKWQLEANRLSAALRRLRENGETILDLTESNPTRAGFRYLARPEILAPLADAGNRVYTPDAQGLPEARRAIARYYEHQGIRLDADQIFLTAGTSEAYSFIFRLLANPGDRILAPAPSYPLLDYLAGLNDVEIVLYPLEYRDRWRIDFKEFPAGAPAPRAVMAVHPNNPTGSYIGPDEKKELFRCCLSKEAALIVDEVFHDFFLDSSGTRLPESFSGNQEVLTFTLSGISKILGLPQMKLSWIVVGGPRKQREEAAARLEIISDTYLSAGTPPQRALPKWFELQPEIHAEILQRITVNLSRLEEVFPPGNPVKPLKPEGGWYAILKMPPLRSDEDWALLFLEKDHVLTHPGYLFNAGREDLTVLSLLPEPGIFAGALRRISETAKLPPS